MIFLLASFIIGLRQIEHKVVLLKRSATRIEKSEMLSELVSSQLKGPPAPILLHSKQGVEIKDPASVNKDIQLLKIEIEVLSESEDKLVSAALRTYNWRNRLLVLGFLLLVVAKIVQPYASGPAAQP